MCGSANSVIFKLKYSCIFILKQEDLTNERLKQKESFKFLEPL